ncbi:hypothetical protein PQO03_19860 [Lentisphaera profundi]|uniref:Uncharacterized protein n=1 Tax=Lentisphaera profundi TaxID=1658616 RepID=A0ABY7VWH4_9BACT|nr:hypothetical protein [Lentisphaera profundi]WDE98077.1 hypothetical protein PQO03_19860 [Lentisphaera profundi]
MKLVMLTVFTCMLFSCANSTQPKLKSSTSSVETEPEKINTEDEKPKAVSSNGGLDL